MIVKHTLARSVNYACTVIIVTAIAYAFSSIIYERNYNYSAGRRLELSGRTQGS
jgi:hypothetical protein